MVGLRKNLRKEKGSVEDDRRNWWGNAESVGRGATSICDVVSMEIEEELEK